MEEARDMGLNTLRLLAFKDGHTLPHAIQARHTGVRRGEDRRGEGARGAEKAGNREESAGEKEN